MVGETKLQQIAKKVLGLSKASETEVLLFVTDHGLTRFANSQIHQNVAWEDVGISVRVVDRQQRVTRGKGFPTRAQANAEHWREGKRGAGPAISSGARIGVASTNSFSDSALRDVVGRAQNLAKLQKEDPHFKSLPKPAKFPEVEKFVSQVTPQQRTEAVSTVISRAKEQKIIASGAFDSAITEVAVANSHGLWAYHASSAANLSTILLGKDSTGFAVGLGKKFEDINAEEVAGRAIDKVVRGRKPIEVKPGQWEVILEPQAVGEMMEFFAWLGPNARVYHEEASHFSGRLGEKVAGNNITIVDDPLDSTGFPMPFDFEGHPKTPLTIIERGVLKNLVYDSYLSGKHGTRNTGHALPAPNTYGPIPLHLKLEVGSWKLDKIIKKVKKGLLVTRFWYVRTLNPRHLSITGMTRDGTFLIKNGEIAGGVKNLRFNQSIPEALKNVVEISSELRAVPGLETELGTSLLPALHIKNWNFTSSTEF